MTYRIYERVSTRGQSLESQHGQLERWAEYKTVEGAGVVWYSDRFTGKTLDRPGFNRLQSEVRAGDTVVVWRLDRLGRTATGLKNLFESWQQAGVGFYSLRDGFDLATPTGRLMLSVMISIAEFETEVRAERIAAGRAGKPRKPSKLKGVRHTVTPEQTAVIIEGYLKWKNVSKVTRSVGLTRKTVYSVLREAGLTEAKG